MKRKKWLALLLATAVTSLVVAPTTSGRCSDAEIAASEYVPTITTTLKENETVDLLQGNFLEFSANYRKLLSKQYLPEGYGPGNVAREDDYAPKSATLGWESKEAARYYTVKLSRNADLSDSTSYMTLGNTLDVEDLFMGTKYYYQVIAHFEDKTVKSRIFGFETSYLPRTQAVEGVSNTRDAGGCYTEDGKHRVRQGLFYRGGKLDDMTASAKDKLLYVYGIKTDLDLRGERSASPLGSGVKFVNVSGPYYTGGTGIDSVQSSSSAHWTGTYRDALLKEIRTFAAPENYPIYFHCSLGRDRTGTLAFLINALLGVGEKDLYRDYESSFFSTMGCLDGTSPEYLVDKVFTDLYYYIKDYKSLPSTYTLAQKTERFMLDIGITQEEIDSIRSILLETSYKKSSEKRW